MKSSPTLVIFSLLAVLMAGVVPAFAQNGPMGPPPGGPHGMPPGPPPPPPDPVMGMAGRVIHELDLRQAQQKQIRAIVHKAVGGDLGLLARSFVEARHALEVRVWDPAATEQDMISALQTLSDRARDLESARRKLAVEILAVLTEDQRAEFLGRLGEEPEPPMGPPPSPR